jgi:hypothetical protein
MRILTGYLLFAFLACSIQACSKEEAFRGKCVEMEYVSISDPYCGRSDQIRIVSAAGKMAVLSPGSCLEKQGMTTDVLMEDMRKAWQTLYFWPMVTQPQMASTNVIGYKEIGMLNASLSRCPN